MIYKLFDDTKRFQSFHIDLEAFFDVLDPMVDERAAMRFSQDDLALADHWTSMSVEVRKNEGSENSVPHIGLWRGATFVLSDTAIELLGDDLEACGELLPLDLNGRRYCLFNCLTEVSPDLTKSRRLECDGFFLFSHRIVYVVLEVLCRANRRKFHGFKGLWCIQ